MLPYEAAVFEVFLPQKKQQDGGETPSLKICGQETIPYSFGPDMDIGMWDKEVIRCLA